jgi:hypothetical protein
MRRSSPNDGGGIGAQLRVNGASCEAGAATCVMFQPSKSGNHRSIVDAVVSSRNVAGAHSLLSHHAAHVSKPLIAGHASAEQQFGFSSVCHRTLGDFDTGSEGMLLQGPAHRLKWDTAFHHGGGCCQDARERHVHASNGKRQFKFSQSSIGIALEVTGGFFLDHGASREGVSKPACELVEHVSNTNVQGFPKHTVAPIQPRDHLRVAPGNVQEHRVITRALGSADFDVGDAMVDAHKRDIMPDGQGPSDACSDLKAGSKTRPL